MGGSERCLELRGAGAGRRGRGGEAGTHDEALHRERRVWRGNWVSGLRELRADVMRIKYCTEMRAAINAAPGTHAPLRPNPRHPEF